MSKPLAFPALAQFAAATTGRNMTKPAYVAVGSGVIMMVLLTVDPAYEAAHHWVDAVLWACLAFFVFEWVVRLRHAVLTQRGWTYALSGRGLVDAAAAAAIPFALGLSVAELARRAGMTVDEIECIEEGGTEPTIALLRRLAAALDSDVHLTRARPRLGVVRDPRSLT